MVYNKNNEVIFKKFSAFCIMFLCITSCVTKSGYTNPCKLVKEKKVIPIVYKYMLQKKLISNDYISDFSEEMYPLPSGFKNVKQIRKKHDSLYSLSIRRKSYNEDCSIKSLLKNFLKFMTIT